MNQYYIVCKEEDKEAIEQKIAELGITRARCVNDANVAIIIGPDEEQKDPDDHVKNPDLILAHALGMTVFRMDAPLFLSLTRDGFEQLVNRKSRQRYQRYAAYRNGRSR